MAANYVVLVNSMVGRTLYSGCFQLYMYFF